jgi:hypothetical protein
MKKDNSIVLKNLNLNNLCFLRFMSLNQLIEIDVSSNKLQSIDFLNQFTNLVKITAKNNNIQRLNLWTYMLMELNLECN